MSWLKIFCIFFFASLVLPGNMSLLNSALLHFLNWSLPRWTGSASLVTFHNGNMLFIPSSTPFAADESPSVVTWLILTPCVAKSSPISWPIFLSDQGAFGFVSAVQSGWPPGQLISNPLPFSQAPFQQSLFLNVAETIYFFSVMVSHAIPMAWDAFWPGFLALLIVTLLYLPSIATSNSSLFFPCRVCISFTKLTFFFISSVFNSFILSPTVQAVLCIPDLAGAGTSIDVKRSLALVFPMGVSCSPTCRARLTAAGFFPGLGLFTSLKSLYGSEK